MSDVERHDVERDDSDRPVASDSENEEGSEQEDSGQGSGEDDSGQGSGQDDSGDDDDEEGEDSGEQVVGAPWDAGVTESEQRLKGCGRTKTQSEVRMLLKSLLRQVQGWRLY